MQRNNFLIAIIFLFSIFSIYIPTVNAMRYMPFIVRISDTPQNADPADANDIVSYNILNQVYEGLYTYNLSSPSTEVIPQLASKMGEWNENMTELTIELRDDVTFHDGSAFNATVVKWNFDRINYFAANNISNPAISYLNNNDELIVKETVIVNNTAIKFILNRPFSIWEQILAFTGSYIIKPNDDFREKFLSLSDEAIGTGPFKMGEITPDSSTLYGDQHYGSVYFKRYEDYYNGPANITDMVYIVIKDEEVGSTAMLNHELHYGRIVPEHVNQADEDLETTIESRRTNIVNFLTLSVRNIPYEIRRAMAFGWNYTYYLKETLMDENYELHTPIPAGMQYYNPNIEGLPYFNKTIARQYMLNCPNITAEVTASRLGINSTDAEWEAVTTSETPLFEANFTRYTSSSSEKIMQQLVYDFAYIGIKVLDAHAGTWNGWEEEEPVDPKFMQISTGRNIVGIWGMPGYDYNDAISMIEPLYKTNATYNTAQLNNNTLDDIISENYLLTGEARAESFDNIVYKVMVENCPSMYLFQRGDLITYNNKFVSNINDLLNILGRWYWYNIKYIPQKDLRILRGTLATIIVVFAGFVSASLIRYRIKIKNLQFTS
ncbi:ABC transporter substrate-binding protein [Promethearchaeum syntrophicum]|uniref:ABC transporter substrate-binding protein n=1 Tax=Promethearchaeum syntrophicum TaxID=2594042 RepID=A0A5B9DF00_9ARCH|nr:ABC transporter substrate-binding protein [Candidatus Prometheoarchaeum syntrophicum]QEE17682.1 Bacterial extracellular solute-binding proteins, family 5 Middle [Candidatus Prometheoarchaeum syntrophicum]